MRQNEDGEWELDPKHFKVICQKCGEVGELDIHKPNSPFSYERGEMPTSDVKNWEYYLCRSCKNEIDEPMTEDEQRELEY